LPDYFQQICCAAPPPDYAASFINIASRQHAADRAITPPRQPLMTRLLSLHCGQPVIFASFHA